MIPLGTRTNMFLEVLKDQVVLVTLVCSRDCSIIQNRNEVVFSLGACHNLEVSRVSIVLLNPSKP
jgi:hypothetical protein